MQHGRRNVLLMYEDIDEFVVEPACFASDSFCKLELQPAWQVNAIEGFKERSVCLTFAASSREFMKFRVRTANLCLSIRQTRISSSSLR